MRVLLCLLLAGCVLTPQTAPLPPSEPNGDWFTLAPGLERRIYGPPDGSQIVAVRIDPAQYIFRVHYRPGEPLRINEWRDALTNPAAIINTNFYDLDDRVLGLLVTDGVRYGEAYTTRGGVFYVDIDGDVRVQPTIAPRPSLLQQAAQAFPMLVENGAAAYTRTEGDRVTRRTAIGQDEQGRIILMVTPIAGLTLADLSARLAESDLNLVHTVNLDGGGSTMLYTADDDYLLLSRDPVPAVLAAYPR